MSSSAAEVPTDRRTVTGQCVKPGVRSSRGRRRAAGGDIWPTMPPEGWTSTWACFRCRGAVARVRKGCSGCAACSRSPMCTLAESAGNAQAGRREQPRGRADAPLTSGPAPMVHGPRRRGRVAALPQSKEYLSLQCEHWLHSAHTAVREAQPRPRKRIRAWSGSPAIGRLRVPNSPSPSVGADESREVTGHPRSRVRFTGRRS